MPAREFTGKLDEPTVREFTGTLDHANGYTAAELGLDPKLYGPNFRGFPSTQSVGPAGPTFPDQLTASLSLPGAPGQGNQDITRGAMQEVARNVAAGDQQIPFLQSEDKQDMMIPQVTSALTTAIAPGSGLLALAGQSAAAGGGMGIGELIRQYKMREPMDFKAAGIEGAKSAGTTAGTGLALKSLGWLAGKFFRTPLNPEQQQAAQFARDERIRQYKETDMSKGQARVPFPLSSAAPGSAAGNIQQGSRTFILGDIKTQVDANKVTQYLNNTVGRMVEKGQVFDDAAKQGQKFLRDVFEPGETALKNTFADYTKAVGADAPIPTTNTLAAVQQVAQRLDSRGQSGALRQRIGKILKGDAQTLTPKEFDELYAGIIQDSFKAKALAGSEGQILLKAITQDLDEFGKTVGVNFADDMAGATALREQFRELRDVPELKRLASEMGEGGGAKGTIDWMNSLFTKGNGKALAKFRELNPNLYHDLADAWLARQIDNAAGYSKGGIGRTVDGATLRTWFEQNQEKIKEIYGAPQAKALDNFTVYAKYMTGAAKRGAQTSDTLGPLTLMGRVGALGAGLKYKPAIVLAGEPASFVLARGLADPNSALFKAFTEGFSASTRAFALKSGEIAAQQATNGKEQR